MSRFRWCCSNKSVFSEEEIRIIEENGQRWQALTEGSLTPTSMLEEEIVGVAKRVVKPRCA